MSTNYQYTRGRLEVIAGPMFAGKSSELLKRLLFIEHSGKKVLVLKPVIDDRYDDNMIVTHNQLKHSAVPVIDLELVKDNYTIMKQEPFGPLVPMLSFKKFDEVIERANNHELGLCSYVCTNSMEKAHLASEQLETGSVAVNTGVVAIAEAPFGGIKDSGYGKEAGIESIKDYTRVKTTWFYTSDEPSLDPFSIR